MRCRIAVAILLLGTGAFLAGGQTGGREVEEPGVTSLLPLGGQRGTSFEIRVRGKGLADAYAAWFPCGDLKAILQNVEKVPQETSQPVQANRTEPATTATPPEYQATLKVEASPSAALGFHPLRLITPRGTSNALPLEIVGEPVTVEQQTPHDTPAEAQRVPWHTVIAGTIGKKGEIDFYAFEVKAGQELFFDVLSDFKMDVTYRAQAEVLLYERTGSWFDASRATLLPVETPVLSWESINALRRSDFAARFVLFPGLRHRFSRDGSYLVSVRAFEGRGGSGFSYALRIAPDHVSLGRPAHLDQADWQERDSATMRQFGSFSRPLSPGRIEELLSRTVTGPAVRELSESPKASDSTAGHSLESSSASPVPDAAAALPAILPIIREQEPNDIAAQAQAVAIPAILEGTIDRPADVDLFRLRVRPGERLAFEIETPLAGPPLFNPWLKVRDSRGHEVITNIFKEYGGDGIEVNKTVERKTVYTFERGGDYILEIRNLVSREGGPQFAYRVLVRPQIPHIGRIEVSLGIVSQGSQIVDLTDHINLHPGEARKLTVLCEKEEGFEGDIAITAGNLPAGVEALPSSPASWTEPLLRGMQYRPIGVEPMSPEHHRPRREVVTLLLVAHDDAAGTTQPLLLDLQAWPIVAGRRGDPLPAGRVPIMLVRPDRPQATKREGR